MSKGKGTRERSDRPNRAQDGESDFTCAAEKRPTYKKKLEIANLIVSIFTLVAAVAAASCAVWLVVATIDAADDAHIAYSATQRPFITIKELKIELNDGLVPGVTGQPPGQIKYWQFTPVFENSGNTLTKDLRLRTLAAFSFYLGPFSLGPSQAIIMSDLGPVRDAPPDPADAKVSPDTLDRNYVIGPHAYISVGGIGVTPDAVNPTTPKWFIYGLATYDDTFPHTARHLMKYCFVVSGIPLVGEQKPVTGLCSHWNCTDNECEGDKSRYITEAAKAAQIPRNQ